MTVFWVWTCVFRWWNRTLCEIVRRRRNNPTWGTTGFDPKQYVATSEEDNVNDQDTETETVTVLAQAQSEMAEFTVADQLMMCWGVGPSKVSLRYLEDIRIVRMSWLACMHIRLLMFSAHCFECILDICNVLHSVSHHMLTALCLPGSARVHLVVCACCLVCLFPYLLACLLACLLIYLFARLFACVLACVLVCLCACASGARR